MSALDTGDGKLEVNIHSKVFINPIRRIFHPGSLSFDLSPFTKI